MNLKTILLAGILIFFNCLTACRKSPNYNDISSDSLVGTVWEYPAGEAYTGEISFSKDTFIFKGLRSKSFISNGIWSYSRENDSISLKFLDQPEYWEKHLKTQPGEEYDYIISIDPKNYSIELKILRESYYGKKGKALNFLGWIFALK